MSRRLLFPESEKQKRVQRVHELRKEQAKPQKVPARWGVLVSSGTLRRRAARWAISEDQRRSHQRPRQPQTRCAQDGSAARWSSCWAASS